MTPTHQTCPSCGVASANAALAVPASSPALATSPKCNCVFPSANPKHHEVHCPVWIEYYRELSALADAASPPAPPLAVEAPLTFNDWLKTVHWSAGAASVLLAEQAWKYLQTELAALRQQLPPATRAEACLRAVSEAAIRYRNREITAHDLDRAIDELNENRRS